MVHSSNTKQLGSHSTWVRDVFDKLKAASNVFEAAKAVVFLLGLIAFLVFLLIGYIATGGDGIGGFVDYLLGGF